MLFLRRTAGLLSFLLLLCFQLPSLSEGALTWVDPPQLIRPGKFIRLDFSATLAGDTAVTVKDASGATAAVLAEAYPAKAGRNNLSWDGTNNGSPLHQGSYTLVATQGSNTAEAKFSLGDTSPAIISAMPSDQVLVLGQEWHFQVETNLESTLTMTLTTPEGEVVIYEAVLPAGTHQIPWDGTVNGMPMAQGSYELSLTLSDNNGFSSNADLHTIEIMEAAAVTPAPLNTTQLPENTAVIDIQTGKINAPSDFSSYPCTHSACFFNLPMGVMDEAAIWAAMMQPMTVVKGEQRQVVKVYAEPSKDAQAVGEVTCDSQGLHVLENLDNGWTRVEAYSSSIHSSKIKNWAGFFTGYIETNKLETKQPNEKYGLLLDKLTQRMYIFQEGKIITELLISTGLVNSKQPYNETPAGEFMIVSRTGGFWSGNMWCDLALRINGGILIHEVPCFLNEETGDRDYGPFERVLGQKASHGCIRVQEELSAEGINMRWLWDNLKLNTRVFIWDDVGRNIPIPDDSIELFYNPDGGKYYHNEANCSSVKSRFLPLTGFTYGEMETSPFDKLTACPYCNPPKRKAEIESLNAGHQAP